MNKQKFFSILYVVMILGLLAFMIFVVKFMTSNATQCFADPIKWFEEKNKGSECFCMKEGIIWPNTIKTDYVEHSPVEYDEFNLSLFNNNIIP